MSDNIISKKQRLYDILSHYNKVVIAFSAGVDSTYLLAAAREVLGNDVIAVTARSCFFPSAELEQAESFCRSLGVKHIVFDADPLADNVIASNPPDRCYHCKKRIFSAILDIAHKNDITYVVDGGNVDDIGDYRPGARAVSELGIKSPLKEAGLTKEEIRILSHEMGLPTWDKPSFACLASRFVYGDHLTFEKLSIVEKAENKLHDMGFIQVRVRHHGTIARIETTRSDLPRLIDEKIADEITAYFRSLGYLYVTADLAGYKTGSMNRTLSESELRENS